MAWSPVEDLLAYVSEQGTLLLVRPGEGAAQEERKVRGVEDKQITSLAWSPDGLWIACVSVGGTGAGGALVPRGSTVKVVGVRRGDAQVRALFTVADPLDERAEIAGWTGDGGQVLFWLGPNSASLWADGVQLLAAAWPGDRVWEVAAVARPSVLLLAVQPGSPVVAVARGSGRSDRARRDVLAGEEKNGQLRLVVQGWAVTGLDLSPVTGLLAIAGDPLDEGVTPDADPGLSAGVSSLWIAESESATPRLILHERDARLAGVRWSRDGQWLFCARQRPDGLEVDVVNRAGSSTATVLTGLGPSPAGTVDPWRLYDIWE
jgi:hypothetical protein